MADSTTQLSPKLLGRPGSADSTTRRERGNREPFRSRRERVTGRGRHTDVDVTTSEVPNPGPQMCAEMRAGFERWWTEWPKVRRVHKDRAARAYVAARTQATEVELLEGVRRTHFDLGRPRFIPNPSTWLHDGCWKDDPAAHARPPGRFDHIRDFVRGGMEAAD